MSEFKTIKELNSSLKGWDFRAICDGEIIRIQNKKIDDSSFVTKLNLTIKEFNECVDEVSGDQMDVDNSEILSKLIFMYCYDSVTL